MKNKTRNRLLTIVLAIAMSAVFMPAAALAEGEVNVTSHAEFVEAIGNTGVTTINVTGDFALTEDVTISREVTITCTYDPGYTITTGGYSIIITGSEAVVNISGNVTMTGTKPIQVTNSGTVTVSGGTITATGEESTGVYVNSNGKANISGGAITAEGTYSTGVSVEVGTVTVSGGSITATGEESTGVSVSDGTGTISGGAITATGFGAVGVYQQGSGGTIIVSGGTITATGDSSSGVYVSDSTAEISGGTIEAAGVGSMGAYVIDNATVTISGDSEISGDAYGVYVWDTTAEISGGTIEATSTDSYGIYVNGGTVTVSGGAITATSTNSYGIYVYSGTVTVSGGTITATSTNSYGIYVYSDTVTVSGGTITVTSTDSYGIYVYSDTVTVSGGTITVTSTDSYGIYMSFDYGGTVTVSVSDNLTISGGVHNDDGTVFLTDLPGPVTMRAGESGTVELTGVDGTIYFEVDRRDTDEELAASIAGSDKDIVNLAPPDTTPAGTYTLGVFAGSGPNTFNLIIPVTVAAPPDTVINVAAIAGVTAPVRDAVPVTAITATDQYTGTVSWSPAVADDKFAADTAYTATITLTAKAGYTLAGVTENFFTVAGATTMSNAAGSGVITAVFPKTEAAPDTVINLAAIAGVTAPVRDAAPVTAITATDQYTGTVSWSPAVADDKFAAETAYTATITLTAKTGYTLTGVTANFFTVAGATTVSNAANSGIITAVFPATAPGSGGGDSGGSGGGDDSSGPPNPPQPVNTNPGNALITSGHINKETGTTPDGKTIETFTVQNTAASQIQQAKEEGRASVEFNIASSQTSVTDIIIPSTVLESAAGLNVSVSTPHATLGLPAALVNALAAAGQNLNLTVSRGGEMADPEGGTVLGTSTEITSDIVGETQVTIPLEGISIPADPGERAAFLSSLAVFTYHSDGETELITGEIIYDANGNPLSISFPVDKFSTFAIVKLSKRTVALTIGSPAASLNGLAFALDAPAYVEPQSNRTLVPLRFIGEAMGAKVEWLPATRQVRINDGKKEIFLTIDSQLALLNGQGVKLDCAPVLAPPGRTFLPLRFIGEALGAEVAYDQATKGIIITREYGK